MMRKLLYLICTIFFSAIQAENPIRIFTYVYNRPDFIRLHVKTFDAFLEEPYEYIVFNDAPNEHMKKKIEQTCAQLNVQCMRVPDHAPHRQSPSYRHMDGIKHSLKHFGITYDGIVMMIDADMFLVRPFSVKSYMQGRTFVGGYQYRCRDGSRRAINEEDFINGYTFENNTTIIYTSPCLSFMDMKNLPNVHTINYDGDRVEGVPCDVGGHTYYYFKNNPTVNPYLYVAVSKDYLVTLPKPLHEYGFDQHSIDLIMHTKREYAFQFHADANFLHFYAGGSNWPKYSASFMQEKTKVVQDYVDKQIAFYKS